MGEGAESSSRHLQGHPARTPVSDVAKKVDTPSQPRPAISGAERHEFSHLLMRLKSSGAWMEA